MSKKLKFVFIMVVTVCLCSVFGINVSAATSYYSTKATATTNQIEVSNDILDRAKDSTIKYGNEFSYWAYLREAYDLHIYHFEAPKGGFYNFYTTGSTDTMIKVYEHQNFMWWTTGYKDRGINDDGCKIASNANASYVLELDKDEDYYICVRGWNTRTGGYTLHVEGNQDKTDITLSHGNYKRWDKTGTSWDASWAQAWGAPAIYAKTYLSKEEVILFYWALTSDYEIIDPVTGKKFSVEGLYNEFKQSTSQAISDINTLLSLITAIPKVPDALGTTATVAGLILDIGYNASTTTKDEMKQILTDKCGAKRTYYSSSYSNGKYYITETIEASHGLCIENTFTSSTNYETGFTWTFDAKNYSTYDDNVRVGVKYEKGDWSR